MDPTVKQFAKRAAELLCDVERLLPGTPRLTLVVRYPGDPSRDMVFTSETDAECAAAAIRRRVADPHGVTRKIGRDNHER